MIAINYDNQLPGRTLLPTLAKRVIDYLSHVKLGRIGIITTIKLEVEVALIPR